MSHPLLAKATEKLLRKDFPAYRIGDTVRVQVKIREGEKERLQAFEGTIMARTGDGRFQRQLPVSAGLEGHIWLIDPLGNVMLRYPPQADPVGNKNDLVRLLKVSRID